MARAARIPNDVLLLGAREDEWRVADTIRERSGWAAQIGNRGFSARLNALVRSGDLLVRRRADGRNEYRRTPGSWYEVRASFLVRAGSERSAEHRIIDRVDSSKVPGVYPVATVDVRPTRDPIELARERLERQEQAS